MSERDVSRRFAFPRWANYLLPVLVVMVFGGVTYAPLVLGLGGDPHTLNVGYQPKQPVPYSHQLHVGQLGMDCRYCHTTVDEAAFASIPSSEVCMNCHNPADDEAGVRKNSDKLAALYESFATGKPVEWVKVHDLPDYSYFDHSAHVNKGVGCATCHGQVDQMGEEGVWQAAPLSMNWCLECHRNPEKYIRPVEEVTNMAWTPEREAGETLEEAQLRLGKELVELYNIHSQAYMTSCSTCHR